MINSVNVFLKQNSENIMKEVKNGNELIIE